MSTEIDDHKHGKKGGETSRKTTTRKKRRSIPIESTKEEEEEGKESPLFPMEKAVVAVEVEAEARGEAPKKERSPAFSRVLSVPLVLFRPMRVGRRRRKRWWRAAVGSPFEWLVFSVKTHLES